VWSPHVGQPGVQERQDRRPPGLDRGGQADDFGDLGVGAPAVEPVEPGADLGVVGSVASSCQQLAQFLFGDVSGQDLTARIVVDQSIPHRRECSVRQSFSRGQQSAAVGPFRVVFAATPAVGVEGDPTPHRGECVVGELDQMEVVDDQHGVGEQVAGDRGGVGGRRVDHHVGDPGPEGLTLAVQPLADRRTGAPFDLSEQALITGEIDEAGVPGVGAHPAATDLVAGPARLAAAGLVDAQHRHRRRVTQHRLGVGHEGGVRGRPGHPRTVGDLDHRAGRVPDAPADLGPQPCGGAPPWRYLRDRFGETHPAAGLVAAPISSLVPPQNKWVIPVPDIARAGDRAFLDRV